MASGTTDSANSASAHYEGMPQLDPEFFGPQIFSFVVAIVVLYFLLSKIAMPRIAAILTERQTTIANDIASAADFKRKAEEAEAAYDQALADARTEAHKIAAAAKAEIQAELDEATAKADAEIAAQAAESETRIREIRDSATKAVGEIATDTAGEIVRALVPSTDDAKAVAAAVTNRMKG
jgi:F-type H+-transporting ATPase subunit b